MSRWIVDIHGDIEGDYDLVRKYEEPNKWIPISERTPEKDVEVLATTRWGEITIAERYSANDWFIHEGSTNANADEIVAWMSLPKGYQGESEE